MCDKSGATEMFKTESGRPPYDQAASFSTVLFSSSLIYSGFLSS